MGWPRAWAVFSEGGLQGPASGGHRIKSQPFSDSRAHSLGFGFGIWVPDPPLLWFHLVESGPGSSACLLGRIE